MVKISTGTIIRAILIVLLVIFLYAIKDILGVVFLSIIIASAVEPAAAWFQKRKVPRVAGVIFVYLLSLLILLSLFYAIIPNLFSEFSSFSSGVINFLKKPEQQQANILREFFAFLPVSLSKVFQSFSLNISSYVENFTGGFFNTTSNLLGGAFSFILVIVLSFYLSVQERGIENFLRIITPLKYEEYIIDLWLRVRRKIGYWMQGQILLGAIVGVLTFLGLTILNINYALSFAILAAVFELIPVFGPILSSIPPIIVAFTQSPFLAIKVAVLYVIIQQFENHLIYPLVVRRIVGIHPVMSILALVIGWNLGGFIGLISSVPIATALVEILDDFDKRKRMR